FTFSLCTDPTKLHTIDKAFLCCNTNVHLLREKLELCKKGATVVHLNRHRHQWSGNMLVPHVLGYACVHCQDGSSLFCRADNRTARSSSKSISAAVTWPGVHFQICTAVLSEVHPPSLVPTTDNNRSYEW
ncbi:hypothetical protein L9F63_009394, partial [Diploptera punctata]